LLFSPLDFPLNFVPRFASPSRNRLTPSLQKRESLFSSPTSPPVSSPTRTNDPTRNIRQLPLFRHPEHHISPACVSPTLYRGIFSITDWLKPFSNFPPPLSSFLPPPCLFDLFLYLLSFFQRVDHLFSQLFLMRMIGRSYSPIYALWIPFFFPFPNRFLLRGRDESFGGFAMFLTWWFKVSCSSPDLSAPELFWLFLTAFPMPKVLSAQHIRPFPLPAAKVAADWMTWKAGNMPSLYFP